MGGNRGLSIGVNAVQGLGLRGWGPGSRILDCLMLSPTQPPDIKYSRYKNTVYHNAGGPGGFDITRRESSSKKYVCRSCEYRSVYLK